MITTAYTLTVRYVETDAQGIVHHSNHLVWFEEGRSDLLRQQGMNYTDFEKAGFFVVVAEANLKYKAPAYYEDEVRIETTLEKAKGKILEFSYRALNAAGVLLAEGRTVHVVVGADRRPTPLPEEIVARLTGGGGGEGG